MDDGQYDPVVSLPISQKDLKSCYPSVIQRCQEATLPYVAPLFFDPSLPGFAGNGTYMKIDGEYGALTAGHVARFFSDENKWFLY
jgi:hypothetical protein